MKKTSTLILALAATAFSVNAQPGRGPMTFAGKSSSYIMMMGNKVGETSLPSDTIIYSGSDFTLPSMKYKDMVIPSFRITGTTYTADMDGVNWRDQSFTATVIDEAGNEKTVTGTSLKGRFCHAAGISKLQLEVSFRYGSMPFPITYNIEGYYVKEFSGENAVTVGGQFGPYVADVVYKVRTYKENETIKMDVEVPAYSLSKTVMGDLYLSTYTVKGLTLDECRGGYYKDYADDNLSIRMTAKNNGMVTMNGEYTLSVPGHENIHVETVDGKVKITNNFQPGSMPFPITAVMTQDATSGIGDIEAGTDENVSHRTYNVLGQHIGSHVKGIVIRNGKKYLVR